MRKYTTQDLWIRVILFFAICVILIISFQQFAFRLVNTLFGDTYTVLAESLGLDPRTFEVNLVRAMNGVVGIVLVYVFLHFDRQKMDAVGFSWNSEFGWEWILLSIPITIAGIIPTIIIEYSFEIATIAGLLDIIGIGLSLLIAYFAFGIGEELLFRGYLQTILETKYQFIYAASISAALFGLLHLLVLAPGGNLPSMFAILFSAFAMGLTFSYVFKTTKYNLIFPIAIHGFWDFIYFAFQADTNYETFAHTLIGTFASIIGAAIIFLCVYLYNTRRLAVAITENNSPSE